ncbi:SHOCT domain-containing protein, partial [Streptomyces sp. NPDC054901]
GVPSPGPPNYDPHTVEIFGLKKDPLMALAAAAVVVRLPHPAAAAASAPVPSIPPTAAPAALPTPAPAGDDHDALLRRLRELGELHTTGILTAEEFALAKAAILRRF